MMQSLVAFGTRDGRPTGRPVVSIDGVPLPCGLAETPPHQAIRDALGIQVPDHFRMRFIERDRDTDALVVLPDPVRAGGELDEHDLDGVSGGGGGNGVDW